MATLRGVLSTFIMGDSNTKQALLLFDNVVAANMVVPESALLVDTNMLKVLERLLAGGAVTIATPPSLDERSSESAEAKYKKPTDGDTRLFAALLSSVMPNLVPLLDDPNFTLDPALPATSASVLRIVLHALPSPNEGTPYEAILDWRDDKDARIKHRRLRAWMNKVARQNLPSQHLQDELATLLDDYDTYMIVQHSKMNRSRTEVVLTLATEVLEDLARFKPSSAITRLFGLLKEDVALLQSELTAPGREIAYIWHAERHFKKTKISSLISEWPRRLV